MGRLGAGKEMVSMWPGTLKEVLARQSLETALLGGGECYKDTLESHLYVFRRQGNEV